MPLPVTCSIYNRLIAIYWVFLEQDRERPVVCIQGCMHVSVNYQVCVNVPLIMLGLSVGNQGVSELASGLLTSRWLGFGFFVGWSAGA